MAFQNNRPNQGGGYQQRGGQPQGRRREGWNDIHQQMFKALFAHPRMANTRTEQKLNKWQAEREPSDDMKSWLVSMYAEWFHQPRKDVLIRMRPDNGQYGQQPENRQDEPPAQQPQQAPRQRAPQQRQPAPKPESPPAENAPGDDYGYADDNNAPAGDDGRKPWER